MSEIIKKLGEFGIIPVIAIDDAETAVPLGQALLNGGLPCAEITFRTAAAGGATSPRSTATMARLVASKCDSLPLGKLHPATKACPPPPWRSDRAARLWRRFSGGNHGL